jgi:hypothetical protein
VRRVRIMFHVNIHSRRGFVKLPQPPPATIDRSRDTQLLATGITNLLEKVRTCSDGALSSDLKGFTNSCVKVPALKEYR